jgi:hypothetical protein
LSSPKSEILLQELEKKKLTINSLFYGAQEKANFSIMGLSVNDLFDKMNIFKNSPSRIKGYINNIIHNPLSNKEDILKRQEFIGFLNREFIVNTLKDYPSKLSKFDRFRKLDKIPNTLDSKDIFKIDIFLENKLDKIFKDINL